MDTLECDDIAWIITTAILSTLECLEIITICMKLADQNQSITLEVAQNNLG